MGVQSLLLRQFFIFNGLDSFLKHFLRIPQELKKFSIEKKRDSHGWQIFDLQICEA